MHSMVYHMPELMRRYSIVKQFTGQGVEKNNDDARKVLLRWKSNNWDSPTDILRTETRLWALRKRERKPRAYNKNNEKYWNSDIKGSRGKRRRLSTQMKE